MLVIIVYLLVVCHAVGYLIVTVGKIIEFL